MIETSDNELDTDCLNEGQIVDNVVQRSSCVKLIVCKNDFENSHFSEPGLESDLIEFGDFSNTELEYMMIPTDCKNVSESMHFSEPDIEFDLIDSRDCTNSEPRLDYIM